MIRLLFYGLLLISTTTSAQPTVNKPDKGTQKLLAQASAIIVDEIEGLGLLGHARPPSVEEPVAKRTKRG